MENWSRLFAYATSMLVIGLAIIVFTENLLPYVAAKGWIGYLALMGYGIIYLNLSYGMNRRFIRRKMKGYKLSYLLGVLLFVPPAIWIYIKDVGLYKNRILFLVILLFAVILGSFFGIKSGIKKRQLDLMIESENNTSPSPHKTQ